MKRIAVVFSGWNNRAVVAFCRYCESRNVQYVIVAKNENDPILQTSFAKNVIYVREEPQISMPLFPTIVKKISNIGNAIPILMPTTEYLNRYFLENRKELETAGYVIPLCSSELYDTVSSKEKFERLCKQNGIVTPSDFDELSKERIPFVIKPRSYFFGEGSVVAEKPKLVLNENDYASLGDIDMRGYYCQEFIGGNAYYLLYYISKDGTYSVYSQKNFVQQHDGLSITMAKSSDIHRDKRTDEYTKMLKNIGFYGLIMIEIREYRNKFYMIEANPRFWGPSQLILDAGMDLFDRFAYDCGLISSLPQTNFRKDADYFWFGGCIETILSGKELSFHNNYTYEKLGRDLPFLLKSDIYKRKDTINVFIDELDSRI